MNVMSVSSTASTALSTSLDALAAKNGVQEYQSGSIRVRYADPVALLKASCLADALANRGGTVFRVAKFRKPSI